MLVVRRGEQPPWIVPDGLWQRIEPLLPKPAPRNPRYPGRKRIPDRQVLCGILFVLHTGIQWEFLPQELGFGSGMTCWRRLEEWNRGVRDPEQRPDLPHRQVRPPVGRDQQDTVRQLQTPRPAPPPVRDHRFTPFGHDRDQLAETDPAASR
jgi:hypothetical protein